MVQSTSAWAPMMSSWLLALRCLFLCRWEGGAVCHRIDRRCERSLTLVTPMTHILIKPHQQPTFVDGASLILPCGQCVLECLDVSAWRHLCALLGSSSNGNPLADDQNNGSEHGILHWAPTTTFFELTRRKTLGLLSHEKRFEPRTLGLPLILAPSTWFCDEVHAHDSFCGRLMDMFLSRDIDDCH